MKASVLALLVATTSALRLKTKAKAEVKAKAQVKREEEEIFNVWAALDADGNGQLNQDEVHEYFDAIGAPERDLMGFKDMFDQMRGSREFISFHQLYRCLIDQDCEAHEDSESDDEPEHCYKWITDDNVWTDHPNQLYLDSTTYHPELSEGECQDICAADSACMSFTYWNTATWEQCRTYGIVPEETNTFNWEHSELKWKKTISCDEGDAIPSPVCTAREYCNYRVYWNHPLTSHAVLITSGVSEDGCKNACTSQGTDQCDFVSYNPADTYCYLYHIGGASSNVSWETESDDTWSNFRQNNDSCRMVNQCTGETV